MGQGEEPINIRQWKIKWNSTEMKGGIDIEYES